MIRRPRRRFSAEQKARIVGLFKQSGLTRVEFCRREGVSLFNLQRWLGKQRQSGEARFVELAAGAIEEQGVIGCKTPSSAPPPKASPNS